jgi:hypothetical protein
MALSFQIAHSDFCRKCRTPPFPQTGGPKQILKPNATTKSALRGCPTLKFQASLTFHKRSTYAAFEKRPRCPSFNCLIMRSKAWDSSKGSIFRILFPSIASIALKPFLRFQDSRPGLFCDLSAGESCPLRIPLAPSTGSELGAAVSPADKSGKNSGLPSVTAKRPQSHSPVSCH